MHVYSRLSSCPQFWFQYMAFKDGCGRLLISLESSSIWLTILTSGPTDKLVPSFSFCVHSFLKQVNIWNLKKFTSNQTSNILCSGKMHEKCIFFQNRAQINGDLKTITQHNAWNSNFFSSVLHMKTRAGFGWDASVHFCLYLRTQTHSGSLLIYKQFKLQGFNFSFLLMHDSSGKTYLFSIGRQLICPCEVNVSLSVCSSPSNVLAAVSEWRRVPAAQHLLLSRGLDGPTLWGPWVFTDLYQHTGSQPVQLASTVKGWFQIKIWVTVPKLQS